MKPEATSFTSSQFYKGILLANIAVLMFSLADVTFKWLSSDYHFSQMLFFRFALGLVLILAWIIPKGIKNYDTRRNYAMHFYRFLAMISAVATSVLSVKYLPLASHTILSFTCIFFTVILSVLFLNEKIGFRRLSAVIAGFIGVVLIVQPSEVTNFNIGVFYGFISAISYAFSILFTKKLTVTESGMTITFYYSIIGVVAMGLLAPFYWQPMTWFDLGLMCCLAFYGTISNLSLANAYKYIPVYIVTFCDYVTLLWAVIFGFLIWSELPTMLTLAGATIIIMSGYYIFMREQYHQKKKAHA